MRLLNKQDNFNIRKANWDGFGPLAEEKFNDDVLYKLGSMDCEEAVKLFNATLEDVCINTIPRKKHGKRTVPWWNNEIAHLRKDTNKAKKQRTRARRMGIRDFIQDCERIYREYRNKYVGMIKKNKQESWRDFVTVEGNKDPWSIVYKIVREKIRASETACSLELPTGSLTMGWRETFGALMEKAVPSDDLESENDRHKSIRENNDKLLNYNMDGPISKREIDRAIRKLKNNKAPGLDAFHNEVLKYLWTTKGAAIFNLLNNCFNKAYFPTTWKAAELIFIER